MQTQDIIFGEVPACPTWFYWASKPGSKSRVKLMKKNHDLALILLKGRNHTGVTGFSLVLYPLNFSATHKVLQDEHPQILERLASKHLHN
jgi:hypothetical protein